MATCKIIIRKSAKNKAGLAPLRLRLLHNSEIKEITLSGARVKPEHWDKDKEKVKGEKMLNLRIQNKKLEYVTAINRVEALGIPINLNQIHESIISKTEITAVQNELSTKTLAEYIRSRIMTNKDFSYGTRKNYRTLARLLEDKYPKLLLKKVDGEQMNQIEKDLLKKNLKVNTIHNRLKCLKAAVNHAYENRVIDKPDFRGFKLKKGSSHKEFLTLEEVKSLYAHQTNLKKYSNDHNILRAFLWACYSCGMRFACCTVLTYEQLSLEPDGSIRLTYEMRKTSKLISVVLNEKATSLIEKEKVGTKEMVFRLLPYSSLILDSDDLSKKIESRNAYVNKRLKLMISAAGIKKKISFHCSRHSFCTNSLTLGIDYFTVKEVAGLSLKVLESTYANVVDDSKTRALKLFD